jgi:hypothetical protein
MKSFKHFIKDEAPIMNTGSGIAGLPPDVPPVSSPVIIRRQNLKKKLKYRMKAANK